MSEKITIPGYGDGWHVQTYNQGQCGELANVETLVLFKPRVKPKPMPEILPGDIIFERNSPWGEKYVLAKSYKDTFLTGWIPVDTANQSKNVIRIWRDGKLLWSKEDDD